MSEKNPGQTPPAGVQAEYKKGGAGLKIAIAAVVAILVAVGAWLLFGGDDDDTSTSGNDSNSNSVDLAETFKVAATSVPHADILKFVQENLAEDAGINFEIEEFSDYPLGNRWVSEGQVDANYFQHLPYFDAQVSEFGFELHAFPGVHIEPYAAFSEKITSLDELADGASISITNDGANQERALQLLAGEGLVELPADGDINIHTVNNIKDFNFIEADPAAQARAVADVDLAILNGNYFLDAGYTLAEALIVESVEDNPYANFLTSRADNATDPRIVKLDELLRSPETKQFIEQTWPGGDVYPAF